MLVRFVEFVRRYRKQGAQVASLYASQAATILLALLINIQYTRNLSVSDFGRYRYVIHFLTFCGSVLTIGLHFTAARMVAKEEDELRIRMIVGATITVVGGICILGSALTLVSVFLVNTFRPGTADWLLLAVAPFVFVFAFTQVITYLLQGANSIRSLALFNSLAPSLVLAASLSLILAGGFGLSVALVVLFAVYSLVTVVWCQTMRPKFKELRRSIGALFEEHRTVGWPMYLGALVGVSVGLLVPLATAAYVSEDAFGHYSLALSVSTPLMTIPTAIGTVMFRANASRTHLPSHVIWGVIGLCVASLAVFSAAVQFLFVGVFGSPYGSAVNMCTPLGAGSVLFGIGLFLSRFLGAHGHGSSLRNGGFVTGGTIILTSVVLLPLLGVWGAIIVRVVSAAAYCATMVWYYRVITGRMRLELALEDHRDT